MTHPRRVAVLDYDAGNLHSVGKALERAGAEAFVTASAVDASSADALVVPGVGSFGACARQFREAGFVDLVERWVADGRPLLGVCVGMQLLYPTSDESPEAEGLGLLPGRVRRLPAGLPVPHMGWNTVRAVREDPVVAGVVGEQCYFAHSFFAEPADEAHVVAVAEYGRGFPCVVRVGSVVATQFHPEKSGAVGARLLGNWLEEVSTMGGVPR